LPWRHWPAIAFQVRLDELRATDRSTASLPMIKHRQHERTPATDACQPPDTLTKERDTRSGQCRIAFALAHWPAIAFQVRLDELHTTDHSTASTSTRRQPMPTSCPTP